MASAAARPMMAFVAAGVSSARRSASARSAGAALRASHPVRPSSTISAMPPHGDASTGRPVPIASTQVFGKFSERDGTTARRAFASRSNSCGRGMPSSSVMDDARSLGIRRLRASRTDVRHSASKSKGVSHPINSNRRPGRSRATATAASTHSKTPLRPSMRPNVRDHAALPRLGGPLDQRRITFR